MIRRTPDVLTGGRWSICSGAHGIFVPADPTNAPVLFHEYDDRIEVQNPGGLYGKVSPANFPNMSDYRNPFIAEAMKVLGYANRFSRGVYRVQKE